MNRLIRTLVTLGSIAAAACGGSQSRVSVKLTDAPGDFKAAVVTIDEIDLVGSGGVTVLSKTKVTTNLLKLSNDAADLVKDAVVQPGTYTQLRFIISGGYIAVEQSGGGTAIYASAPNYEGLPAGATVAGSLQMPSFAQSGLKVDLPGGVDVSAQSKILLVDFNVEQSFGQQAGGSGQWVMHPALKAIDFQLSGNLQVNAQLATGFSLPVGVTLGAYQAQVLAAGTSTPKTVALTTAAGGSVYGATFNYLFPGSYTVSLVPVSSSLSTQLTTNPAIPYSANVVGGAATTAAFTVTGTH